MASAGGSLHESPPQMGPLAASRLAPLRLLAVPEREFRMTVCFILAHSVAQTRWSLCSCSPTHTNTLAYTRMRPLFLITQQYKARIMMTGGGVMLLSSIVFTLVICK